MKKPHLAKQCLASSDLANIPEKINQHSLASVLKELLQIIRNEQLSLHSAYKGPAQKSLNGIGGRRWFADTSL